MSYEELLDMAKKHSDHSIRVQEFEPAIIESFANTDSQYPALEIGNRDGGSAMLIVAHILKEGKERHFYTADVNGAPNLLKEWLPKLGIIWTHVVSTQENFIRDNKEPWGFVYLDADHDHRSCTRDIGILAPRLAKGCIVAVDDTHDWPELPEIEGLERVEFQVDEGRDWSNTKTKHHITFYRKKV